MGFLQDIRRVRLFVCLGQCSLWKIFAPGEYTRHDLAWRWSHTDRWAHYTVRITKIVKPAHLARPALNAFNTAEAAKLIAIFGAQRDQTDVDGVSLPAKLEWEHRFQLHGLYHPCTDNHSNKPACQQAWRLKGSLEQSKNDRRKNLENPDAAQKLKIDSVLGRKKDNKYQRSELHPERNNFGDGGL